MGQKDSASQSILLVQGYRYDKVDLECGVWTSNFNSLIEKKTFEFKTKKDGGVEKNSASVSLEALASLIDPCLTQTERLAFTILIASASEKPSSSTLLDLRPYWRATPPFALPYELLCLLRVWTFQTPAECLHC